MAPAVASNRDAAVCPTDDEAITPRNRTRSWDYVWRSGVAGGLAGCAVSTILECQTETRAARIRLLT